MGVCQPHSVTLFTLLCLNLIHACTLGTHCASTLCIWCLLTVNSNFYSFANQIGKVHPNQLSCIQLNIPPLYMVLGSYWSQHVLKYYTVPRGLSALCISASSLSIQLSNHLLAILGKCIQITYLTPS